MHYHAERGNEKIRTKNAISCAGKIDVHKKRKKLCR